MLSNAEVSYLIQEVPAGSDFLIVFIFMASMLRDDHRQEIPGESDTINSLVLHEAMI